MESLMKTTLLKASVVAATLVLAAGCASNGDLEKVREEAAAAQQTADEAKSAAAAAAQATADEAKQLATDANTKIDRAFRKSMYK
jgi:murein lipoprotein